MHPGSPKKILPFLSLRLAKPKPTKCKAAKCKTAKFKAARAVKLLLLVQRNAVNGKAAGRYCGGYFKVGLILG